MLSEKLAILLLATMPNAKQVSGRRQILTRCMYCGDSKHARSAHFYISLDDAKPFFYYCQKCHTTGIVDHKKLMEWGLYDQDVNMGIIQHNKVMFSKKENYKFVDSVVYNLRNNIISDNELSKIKLKYINNRLGLDLTYSDLLKNKIILNLYDLLRSNNINQLSRDQRITDELDRSFIGFISQDNAFINMRNLRVGKVYQSIDKRYVNYNIFNKFNNTQRFFTLPTNIDLSLPKKIKLNIAEGPFDILSVFYNLKNQEPHSIYSAIIGSGYLNILRHFIIVMKLIYIEVHIYIDNDVEDYVINSVYKFLEIYKIPLYVHRNTFPGEKDFGVSIEKINETITQLL
ncbi:MAG: hypothetical protein M0P49_02065 [Bacilli bacterium]|nr:hypothetical protein [Bacilli bacterium]